ncbi:ATP-dependent DNA helicase II subunit 2 [Sparassis crispa]|uniref:ATP-dependent DNA helicase II subunit 2 n=1 Tax=Sparassis crispa TaxID=139825 RepID=A0A401G953_9APHY|nr:ATP-dependent DNA helicase II subunit 2 [Sparassis crispa]GBE78688.1 ATP-dependent DNA helicase II subunit 2 [Sparassis crispa]
MPAERAGYTVTMFLVDISSSMGKMRQVEIPNERNDEPDIIEMTNLEWSLQFVMLKIQEMIFNSRKTDQCGVILFGSEETDNMINEKNGGYENVSEYIPIAQPNAGTLAKLAALRPSEVIGDPIDALIVGIETQNQYLSSKKTWTRKIVLLTDGENPIEIEDWETTAKKMNSLDIRFTVVGVDFDDENFPFHEEDKSEIKHQNESFFHTFVSSLNNGIVGNCDFALRELARPDIKQVKSALLGTVLRLGDVDARPEDAIEIHVKTSKCTALSRPKSWKKFTRRDRLEDEEEEADNKAPKAVFAQLQMRTEYFVQREGEDTDEENVESEQREEDQKQDNKLKVEKEQLVRGFKYGASYAPCPDGQFPRLVTRKGIDICGFFKERFFRRDYCMGEVSYVWADPTSPMQQVALSSFVQAMYEKGALAIARWVGRDGADPKMGVLAPSMFQNADCLLWVQMPFADDVRNFPFASLDTLISKKGETLAKHPYLPTEEQVDAMEQFVDAMDLSDAGEKDEDGVRQPWYDNRLSYNPAVHRTKQALFHSAIVSDLGMYPLPPPHPELLKYFEPPRRVLKRAHDAIEECNQKFKVKEVPKKIAKTRKDGHVRARDEDEDMLLLDRMPRRTKSQALVSSQLAATSQPRERAEEKKPKRVDDDSETESESEDDQDLLLNDAGGVLPTPARSETGFEAGLRPGRVVGSRHPLKDFHDNLARGDIVTKSVEDLAAVIKEITVRPSESHRMDELLECMQELRKVSCEEDEIDAWNGFLPDLRKLCVDEQPGNKAFWARVKKLGRDISLISKPQARKLGGKSNISEAESIEFIEG